MLVVAWLNSVRYFAVVDGKETLGADLFVKLGLISSALLNPVLQTAYYIACHTGSLDRVFRQVDLSMNGFSLKYSRRVKVVTVISWLFTVSTIIIYMYVNFAAGKFNDITMLIFINTFHVSKPYVEIIKTVCAALELQSQAVWSFTQTMN